MTKKIETNDMMVLEEMAKRYGFSMVQLGQTIVTSARQKDERQFKLSQDEYDVISQKAKAKGLTVMRYCEYACGVFLNKPDQEMPTVNKMPAGSPRSRRITVQFKDAETEAKLLAAAERFGSMGTGALIRYCALNY